jgi:hypothetical protein
MLPAHLLKSLHASFIARAPCFDAAPDPGFFLGELSVELRGGALFDRHKLVLFPKVGVELPGI